MDETENSHEREWGTMTPGQVWHGAAGLVIPVLTRLRKATVGISGQPGLHGEILSGGGRVSGCISFLEFKPQNPTKWMSWHSL